MMTQPSIAGTRVLIVEDEAVVVMMMEAMLDELGCVVAGVAGHVDEANALVAGGPVDCALVDINLAGTSAYPLARDLAARGIPFVFVTGYDRPDVDAEFRGRPVLRKPFELESLSQAMAAALSPGSGAADPAAG